MTLRIGVIATNLGNPVNKETLITSDFLMKSSGTNIGNWAFWHGMSKLTDDELLVIPGHPHARDYKNKVDIIAIPAANWLQPRTEFSWLADFIEEMDKPCLMLGLGAQSHNKQQIPTLSDGTVRMLKAVSSRTPYIGVRGEYTYQVCTSHGIDNVKVLGCPSLFINNNSNLGADISNKWNKHKDGKTVIHAAMFPKNVKHVEQWLFDNLCSNYNYSYIIQAHRPFIKPLFQEELNSEEVDFIDKYKDQFREEIKREELLSILFNKSYSPCSISTWMNYLSFFSRSIGTRIHGSVLSISATVPTICVTHDTRTSELCEVMQIPAIKCEEITSDSTVNDIFDEPCFNPISFNDNRHELAKKYKNLLEMVGMQCSKHLSKLT